MAYKSYSDAFKNEVLIRLAVNKHDYDKTAEQMGVSTKSIQNWEKVYSKKSIPELLDRAIERLLMVIPADMKANDWAIALGILFDKWLLMQGEPTNRTETIDRRLRDLDDNEFSAVIAEAEAIIQSASSRKRDTAGDNGQTPN